MMKKRQILTGYFCVLGLILLALGSCVSYQRNYPGPLRDQGEVAFLLRDSMDQYKLRLEFTDLNNPPSRSSATLTNYIQCSKLLQPDSPQPNCLEILPGQYSVQAWASESSDAGSYGKYGPYDMSFEAHPGHIYYVDGVKKYREKKKLWFLTLKEGPYYDVSIKDMTFSGKYQDILAEIERK